jgi:hypothetical protein
MNTILNLLHFQHSGSSSSPLPHTVHSRFHLSMREAYTMWRVMIWLYEHRVYYQWGVLLFQYVGEYCLKLILSHMNPSQARIQKNELKKQGINVDSMTFNALFYYLMGHRLSDLENQVLKIVERMYIVEKEVEGIIFSSIESGSNHCYSDVSAVFSKIFENIRKMSSFKVESIDSKHRDFARYILNLKGDWTHKHDIMKKAHEIYMGSNWVEVGLSAIETKFEERKIQFDAHLNGTTSSTPSEEEVMVWLKTEHDHWLKWSVTFRDILDLYEPRFLDAIKEAQTFIYKNLNSAHSQTPHPI